MGFDGRPDLLPVEAWMSALRPTREKPTAMKYRDTIVVYWREGEEWTAREFGRPGALSMTSELSTAIEADQRRAREKLNE
jgi:hypothetical protein